MSAPTIVIIARSDHAPTLQKRLGSETIVAVFPDSESLRAMDAILARPPRVVALDPTFVTTARGAALVAQVKAEPNLASVDIRVLAHDDLDMPLILAQHVTSWETALHKLSMPLDRCGTRRGMRFPVNGDAAATVNGERCQLIDLSVSGAQILLRTRLRPDQTLRINLIDRAAQITVRGIVAWSIAESSGGIVHYRAGVKFVDANTPDLEAFCARVAGVPSNGTFGAA